MESAKAPHKHFIGAKYQKSANAARNLAEPKRKKTTELIEQSIDLEANVKPFRGTLSKYTQVERKFAS